MKLGLGGGMRALPMTDGNVPRLSGQASEMPQKSAAMKPAHAG